jgi:hypothetical protein
MKSSLMIRRCRAISWLTSENIKDFESHVQPTQDD